MTHRSFGRHFRRGMLGPDILLFAGTRTAIGIGIGLLLARRLNNDQRKAAGISLAVLGGFTTIPLAMRFANYRRWRQHWREQGMHEAGCRCGCPYCCEAGSGSGSTPVEGSTAPAA